MSTAVFLVLLHPHFWVNKSIRWSSTTECETNKPGDCRGEAYEKLHTAAPTNRRIFIQKILHHEWRGPAKVKKRFCIVGRKSEIY